MLDRRDFLGTSLMLAAGMSGAGWAHPPSAAGSADPLFKISLAEWSLQRLLFGGTLDHLEFAETAKANGIEAVEYVNQFFMDKAKDRAYLREMKKRADGEGVRSVLIMCDREGHLGDPDEARRMQAVENHHKWVAAAQFLGCHAIRVNARSAGGYEEQGKLAADGLRHLGEFADDYDIDVLVENHGGLSSNGRWLAAVMEKADHPRVGTLPDFGNFRISETETYNSYRGVEELMPYARGVSVKPYVYEQGSRVDLNYRRMMRVVLDAGYRGYCGIEYGPEGRELEGIRKVNDRLEQVRGQLAASY